MADFNYDMFSLGTTAKDKLKEVTQKGAVPAGIGAKPADEQEPMDKGFYESMYEAIMSYFDNAEEADKVLTGTKPSRDAIREMTLSEFDDMTLRSAEEAGVLRQDMGKTKAAVPEERKETRLVDVTDTEEGKLTNEEPLYELAEEIDPGTIETKGLMSKPDGDSADGVQPTDGKDFETRLEDRLVELEGFRAEPYKPDEDEEFLTIGYGHYGSDVKEGTVLTEPQARDLLRKDIKKRIPQIKKSIKNFDSLSDDLKVEIAQSWFRGGISGSPKTIKLINEGKFDEAAVEFLDNEEYRTTELGGVKTRMEALSAALKAEAL